MTLPINIDDFILTRDACYLVYPNVEPKQCTCGVELNGLVQLLGQAFASTPRNSSWPRHL